MNKALGLLALVSIIALQAAPASARCIKQYTREDICSTTSDGRGQAYTAGPQALTAGKWWARPGANPRITAELANRRRHHFH